MEFLPLAGNRNWRCQQIFLGSDLYPALTTLPPFHQQTLHDTVYSWLWLRRLRNPGSQNKQCMLGRQFCRGILTHCPCERLWQSQGYQDQNTGDGGGLVSNGWNWKGPQRETFPGRYKFYIWSLVDSDWDPISWAGLA